MNKEINMINISSNINVQSNENPIWIPVVQNKVFTSSPDDSATDSRAK